MFSKSKVQACQTHRTCGIVLPINKRLRGWVRFPTGGKARDCLLTEALTRFNSVADSKVWMKEDGLSIFLFGLPRLRS
jgi:hypothetical protein